MEIVTDFILGSSKITADGDYSHLEIKRHLLLGRKAMSNLDSLLKSRDITLPTKVHLVKAMVFSVVMYGCEKWTIKKAEHWRIDVFELWCLRRLLRVLWTMKRSHLSFLNKISPEYSFSFSWNSNTLTTWCKEPTHWKRPWCWERLKEGGEGGNRGWDGWMASLTQWTWVWASSRSWWWTGKPVMLKFMGLQRVRHDWATELNWWISGWCIFKCHLCLDFPGGSDSKASVYNAGDLDSIPGSGRSPGEGNGNPLQYYCLENPMDIGDW